MRAITATCVMILALSQTAVSGPAWAADGTSEVLLCQSGRAYEFRSPYTGHVLHCEVLRGGVEVFGARLNGGECAVRDWLGTGEEASDTWNEPPEAWTTMGVYEKGWTFMVFSSCPVTKGLAHTSTGDFEFLF